MTTERKKGRAWRWRKLFAGSRMSNSGDSRLFLIVQGPSYPPWGYQNLRVAHKASVRSCSARETKRPNRASDSRTHNSIEKNKREAVREGQKRSLWEFVFCLGFFFCVCLFCLNRFGVSIRTRKF